MIDLYIDPLTGDVSLGGTHQTRLTTEDEAVLQRLRTRLRRWYGEWFHDPTLGIPYRTEILRKNPDLALVKSLLRTQILGTAGVTTVTSLDLIADPVTRDLSVNFEVLADSGTVLRGVGEMIAIVDEYGDLIALDDGESLVE